MNNIYLVVTQSGSLLSTVLKLITKKEYNHISLSLNNNLDSMYSFGRKSPYNPFVGVFVVEQINCGTYKRFKNTKCKVVELNVTDEQYEMLKNNIYFMVKNNRKYSYNFIGLVFAGINIQISRNNKFYCSEFVRYILANSNIDVSMIPNIAHPTDFFNMNNNCVLYEGLLNNYDKKLIKRRDINE